MKRNRSRNRRDDEQPAVRQRVPKRTWHPLSLQQLHGPQFIDVVNGILDGRNELFQGSLRGATGEHGEVASHSPLHKQSPGCPVR